MKNDKIKNTVKVATTALLVGCITILVAACAPNTVSEGAQIDAVTSIMLNERDTDSPIQYQGIADESLAGKGKYSLHDDLFEYVFDPDGYFISAIRAHDKTSDNSNATSENPEDLETRALNLHQRNLGKWLKGDNSIVKRVDPMGTLSFEITETINGNPTGRITYVTFSKGGALIMLVSVNKPVSEADLAKEAAISEDQAAEIAFADLMKEYGDVLENKDFSKAHWTAVKEAIQQHLVWTITIDQLTRTDFPIELKGIWAVRYRVDVLTGEIRERAYAS